MLPGVSVEYQDAPPPFSTTARDDVGQEGTGGVGIAIRRPEESIISIKAFNPCSIEPAGGLFPYSIPSPGLLTVESLGEAVRSRKRIRLLGGLCNALGSRKSNKSIFKMNMQKLLCFSMSKAFGVCARNFFRDIHHLDEFYALAAFLLDLLCPRVESRRWLETTLQSDHFDVSNDTGVQPNPNN